jgi:hypothetical protein
VIEVGSNTQVFLVKKIFLDWLACRILFSCKRERQATTGTLKCYDFIEGRGTGTRRAVKIL